jgi:hypothetical protein
MTVSRPRDEAASIASNATAAGSPPGAPATQGTRRRSAHTWSWLIGLEPPRQLGGSGGLARAVHPDEKDHRGATGAPCQRSGTLGAIEKRGEPAFERLPKVRFGLELALSHLVFQGLGQLHRGGHAEIGLDQHLLEPLEVLRVEAPHERPHVREGEALDPGPETFAPILQSAISHAES